MLFFLAYTTNRSCLDVNRECIEDEVCNKQLSLYLKVCSVNRKCNVEGCQAAIRFFYQHMPFEVAQMMIFCDCIQRDESCHRAKELLHGKSCAVTVVPPPSCLNLIHMCEENDSCRWVEVFCSLRCFWITIWSNHFYGTLYISAITKLFSALYLPCLTSSQMFTSAVIIPEVIPQVNWNDEFSERFAI